MKKHELFEVGKALAEINFRGFYRAHHNPYSMRDYKEIIETFSPAGENENYDINLKINYSPPNIGARRLDVNIYNKKNN